MTETQPDGRSGAERWVAEEAADARAFRVFCTPHLSRHRPADQERLVERARFHLRSARGQRVTTSRGELQTYVFEPDGAASASVILVHGWTGEAAFMSAFADYFRRRGLRSVLLDLPAHGRSDGSETNLIDCALAVHEIAQAMGPIRFAVGHSIGGLAALVAGEGCSPMPKPYPFETYVLVAMPDRFGDVTLRFGAEQGLSSAEQRGFEQRLERLAGREIGGFTGANLLSATGKPAVMPHSRDDEDVPFADAERLAAAAVRAELLSFDGLGHRAILYAPPAIRAAATFLCGRI